jgi:TatD DNase family protein
MSEQEQPSPREFQLSPSGIDTHAHLDLKGFGQDLERVLQRAREAGVSRIGNVFLGPEAYARNKTMFEGDPRIFFLLGIHPHEAGAADEAAVSAMAEHFRTDERLKGLGEIGLDFYRDRSPREQQIRAFRLQLELAAAMQLPVVIHSREADEESLRILQDMGWRDRPLLWHCYSREPDFGRELVSAGWMISVPGIVTYPGARALRESVRELPLEHLVLETDCPFLAPQPVRGQRNEPANIAFTAAAIAELKNRDIEEVWRTTSQNAVRFFGLRHL